MPLMTTLTTISAQKSFGASYIIPANSVIMMDGTYSAAIGTWDLYSDALNKLIVGTTEQVNVGVAFASTGQSSSTAGSIGSQGDHYGASFGVPGGTGSLTGYQNNGIAGNHTHSSTWIASTANSSSDIKPVHTTYTLLRTNANTTFFPANTVHISATNIYSGTQELAQSSNRYIVGGSNKTYVAATSHSITHTTSDDGANHNHFNGATYARVNSAFYGALSQNGYTSDYQPEHNHTLTKTVSISNLRGKLLKVWLAAASSIPKSSVIIMYCGDLSILPSYWKVCDGTNGTIDMQNYFLGYATSSATAHETVTSASTQYTLNADIYTSSNDWQHSHYAYNLGYQTNMYVNHLYGNHSHNHTVSGGSLTSNYEPACIKLAFIQLIPS
jgi:hypothetical protein